MALSVLWSPRVTKIIGHEQLGSRKMNRTMGVLGDSDLKGPLEEPPKLEKWVIFNLFQGPECHTDSSAVAIQCGVLRTGEL